MKGKIDQLAFYCANPDQEQSIIDIFGLSNEPEVVDVVKSTSKVLDTSTGKYVEGVNKALLKFWYSKGIEFEILRYLEGPNWHGIGGSANQGYGYLSHYGVHLDDDQPMPDIDLPMVQENFTISHTAEYLTSPASPGYGRKYHYRIYQMHDGTFLKLIKRIHPKVSNGNS